MEKENTLNHLFKLDNKVNDTYEDSFEILTLYRSIYIIKRKFEIYKIQIKQIYNKYNINEFNNNIGINFYVINTDNFYLIAKEIFNIINCFIIHSSFFKAFKIFLSSSYFFFNSSSFSALNSSKLTVSLNFSLGSSSFEIS